MTSDLAADVDIVVATYNGSPWLGAQVESLLGQSHQALTILIGDDGSTDGTREIAADLARRHPHRIRLLEAGPPTGSAAANFSRLLAASHAPYVMPCDQDDIWLPQKVAVSLDMMRRAEAAAGPGQPVLVHTDLRVVRADLSEIAPSFWRYQALRPFTGQKLRNLLLENCVVGCTILANRPLLDLALPLPPEAVMHDWWLALHAAAFGRLIACHQQTVQYRQHCSNVVGATGWNWAAIRRQLGRVRHPFDNTILLAEIQRAAVQAQAFLRRHRDRLDPDQIRLLTDFVALPDLPNWQRKAMLFHRRLFRGHPLRTLSLLLRI